MKHSIRPFILLLAGVLLGSVPAAAQSGLAFLRVGPDAAHMALGDAGTAVASGPFASERNPAGLVGVPGTEVALTHQVWIADVRTYGASARFGQGEKGGIGLYLRATSSGDLEARDGPGPASGTFEAQFLAAGVAYARAFGPVRAGAAVKFLSERIFSVAASGVAFDAGMQADLLGGGVTLGLVYQHAGTMSELAQRSTRLPRTIRAAVAVYPFRVLARDDGAMLMEAFITAEVSRNVVDEITQWHFAASAVVMETIRARAGYLTNDALRGVSFGAGLSFSDFVVDYAIVPFEDGFGGPGHVFTLAYSL